MRGNPHAHHTELSQINSSGLASMNDTGWTPGHPDRLPRKHYDRPRAAGQSSGLQWLTQFPEFARTLITIRDKSGDLRRLVFNPTQRRYYQQRQPREIILKFRQPGFSTLFSAEQFFNACTVQGFRGVTIAHEREATQRLQERIRLMYDQMKVKPKAKYNRKAELTFSTMGSTLYVGTAGGRSFGRGDTIHYAHCSEVAFWPDPVGQLAALSQAIPANGRIKLESTPNGFNSFYTLCKEARAGIGPYTLQFFPWFIHPEYRAPADCDERDYTEDERLLIERAARLYNVRIVAEQITWRRKKQAELKDIFAQEYPEDEHTCFLTSGRPRFNVQKLNSLLLTAQTTPYSDRRAIPDTALQLTIWEAPRPGEFYILAADSAEGAKAGDYNSGSVYRWVDGRKVATLHGKSSLFQYADELCALAGRYNNAVLAIERNHPGPAVIARCVEKHYPNLYYAIKENGQAYEEPGWHTNSYTRPIMVDTLDEFILNSPAECWPDEDEIGEALSFVIGPTGKSEASQGAHDDRVIERAIALMVREQTRPPQHGKRKARDWNPKQI